MDDPFQFLRDWFILPEHFFQLCRFFELPNMRSRFFVSKTKRCHLWCSLFHWQFGWGPLFTLTFGILGRRRAQDALFLKLQTALMVHFTGSLRLDTSAQWVKSPVLHLLHRIISTYMIKYDICNIYIQMSSSYIANVMFHKKYPFPWNSHLLDIWNIDLHWSHKFKPTVGIHIPYREHMGLKSSFLFLVPSHWFSGCWLSFSSIFLCWASLDSETCLNKKALIPVPTFANHYREQLS